jgi:AcrR family transcriptional regulator/DNA-binding MarR family transcriptional regulator
MPAKVKALPDHVFREGQADPSKGVHREGGHVLEMQRRRILLACVEVLAVHGLQGASVDRICRGAGVSRRTFYDLFADREACFLAAFELAVEQVAAQIAPLYMCTGRWRVRVRAALAALLELFDSEPALARLCVVETLKAGPAILGRRRMLLDALVAAVDEGRGEGRGAAPPPLTAEGVVGGVLSVIHTHLVEPGTDALVALVNPLMSMIVHPYLGPAAAARELEHSSLTVAPARNGHSPARVQDPFKDLPIRITFRTARVLAVIGAQPGASNRAIGDEAGVADQGQISKLLRRLERCELVSNSGKGHSKGESNAWRLTERGWAIQRTIEPPGLSNFKRG